VRWELAAPCANAIEEPSARLSAAASFRRENMCFSCR
jgi:hypothetical protein